MDQAKEKPSVTVYIYFKSGSAELANDFSKKQLAAVAKALSAPALASSSFEIGGHTDSQGSDALNQALSEQRAAHIRDLLVHSHGLQANRLSAKGYGKNEPVAGNDTEAGRAKNRRVVIKRLD
jgi:OOP family OmpA-OmpF porin